MTNTEKQLLLKDLCGRLPYWIILDTGTKLRSIDILAGVIHGIGTDRRIEDIKYYLRPMDTMTEEERLEYDNLACSFDGISMADSIDFLNAHHFDYRGLIPMGLALEAPDDMYKED